MLAPKGMLDGQYCPPKGLMIGTRGYAGGGHPLEVGEQVGILLESLPIGLVVGAADGLVVLGLQPGAVLMVEVGLRLLGPLVERSAVAMLVGEQPGQMLGLPVHPEGREYRRRLAELLLELGAAGRVLGRAEVDGLLEDVLRLGHHLGGERGIGIELLAIDLRQELRQGGIGEADAVGGFGLVGEVSRDELRLYNCLRAASIPGGICLRAASIPGGLRLRDAGGSRGGSCAVEVIEGLRGYSSPVSKKR